MEAVVKYKEVVDESAKIWICFNNFPIHDSNLVGSVCRICSSGAENVEDGVEDIEVVKNVLLETGKLG